LVSVLKGFWACSAPAAAKAEINVRTQKFFTSFLL
jgi:hypothetical protein